MLKIIIDLTGMDMDSISIEQYVSLNIKYTKYSKGGK